MAHDVARRIGKVGVGMSGGLDSTNMAAAALEAGQKRGRPVDLRAITAVYDRLIPDQERHFAGLAANFIIQYESFTEEYKNFDRNIGFNP